MANIAIARKYILRRSPDFDQNVRFLVDEMNASDDVKKYKTENGSIQHYDGVDNNDISKEVLMIAASKGGDISHCPLFIKVLLDEEVPVGIPNSEQFDEEGVPQGQKTWEEWKDGDHNFFTLSDGNTYIGSNASNGEDLPLSLLLPVIDDLITQGEFKSLSEVNEIE